MRLILVGTHLKVVRGALQQFSHALCFPNRRTVDENLRVPYFVRLAATRFVSAASSSPRAYSCTQYAMLGRVVDVVTLLQTETSNTEEGWL
jgi:hypothetical protein